MLALYVCVYALGGMKCRALRRAWKRFLYVCVHARYVCMYVCMFVFLMCMQNSSERVVN